MMVLGIGVVIVMQVKNGIFQSAQELRTMRVEAAKLEMERKDIERYRSFVLQKGSEWQSVNALFVNAETPIDFVEFLEEVAGKSGAVFSINPGERRAEEGERWPFMRFQISSSSSYLEFLKILYELENSPYLITVEGVTVNNSRLLPQQGQPSGIAKNLPQNPEGIVDFSISFKVYVR